MTLRIKGLYVTLSISATPQMTLSITMLCLYTVCHYADCHVLFIIMLNVIMLSIVMLIVVMLNVIILIVVVPINCVAKLIGENLKVARDEFSTLS